MPDTDAVPSVIEETPPRDKPEGLLGDERIATPTESVEENITTDVESTSVETVADPTLDMVPETGLGNEEAISPVFEETEASGHAASGREEC